MSKFLKVAMFLIFFSGSINAVAQAVDLEIKYNNCTNVYEVHMIVVSQITTVPGSGYYVGSSGVGIVFPGVANNVTPVITSVEAGPWSTASKINDYTFNSETTDQWKVITGGSTTFIPESLAVPGSDIILFTFPSPTGSCLPGVRLFNNWTSCNPPNQLPVGSDVCSGQPGFQGADHRSSIFLDFDGIDGYSANRNNGGTVCSNGFDFGDLTAAWPSARAAVTSPDCDNNGRPDGPALSVWAGNRVDAEASQRFSSQATVANGDDLDGAVNDEDGLLPTAIIIPGNNEDFTVRLNANANNTTVFYGLYADWDNNGSFESFTSGSGLVATAGTPVSVTATLFAPLNASPDYKMRLIVSNQAVTAGGFNDINITNGEVEDYSRLIILPIEGLQFSGQRAGQSAQLLWKTQTEKDYANFTLERSVDGQTFAVLGNQRAFGGYGGHSYNQFDRSPSQGVNYYRLKVTRSNGTVLYSSIVRMDFGGSGSIISVYPNPARQRITISSSQSISRYSIKDLSGRVLLEGNGQNNNVFTINLPVGMPGGIYFVETLDKNDNIVRSKFAVQ